VPPSPTQGERLARLEEGQANSEDRHAELLTWLRSIDRKVNALVVRQTAHLAVHRYTRWIAGAVVSAAVLTVGILRLLK